MKKVLLHVGPHKTGSSYLQACFRHYGAALRGRGIMLPAAWEQAPDNPSHTGLIKALLNNNLAGARMVLENASAAGCETLLVSAEDLSVQPVEVLQQMRSVIGDAEVIVVFYVRRWTDLVPSVWQELIKQGQSTSLPEYFSWLMRNPEGAPEFNLELKLASLIEVFGAESIRLVCFSTLEDSEADIFVHFAKHFLGWWNAEPLPGTRRYNTSRGVREIELLRQMNAIELLKSGRQSSHVREQLDAAPPSETVRRVLEEMEPHCRTLPFNDFPPALQRMHRAMRERFNSNVVRPSLPDLFFRQRKHPLPFVASDYLLRRGVVDALHEIYAGIMD